MPQMQSAYVSSYLTREVSFFFYFPFICSFIHVIFFSIMQELEICTQPELYINKYSKTNIIQQCFI